MPSVDVDACISAGLAGWNRSCLLLTLSASLGLFGPALISPWKEFVGVGRKERTFSPISGGACTYIALLGRVTVMVMRTLEAGRVCRTGLVFSLMYCIHVYSGSMEDIPK